MSHVHPRPYIYICEPTPHRPAHGGRPCLWQLSVVLSALFELDHTELALQALCTLPVDVTLQDSVASADLHTVITILWAVLALRQYDHALVQPLLLVCHKCVEPIEDAISVMEDPIGLMKTLRFVTCRRCNQLDVRSKWA